MNTLLKYLPGIAIFLLLLGLLDSVYLTIEHFRNVASPCSLNFLSDCGKVLNSDYSLIFDIPLALIGVIHYLLFLSFVAVWIKSNSILAKNLAIIFSLTGFFSSLYFVYLQLFVIQSICVFCMLSAILSTFVALIINYLLKRERKILLINLFGLFYKHIIKYFLFKTDPELIHNIMVRFGEVVGIIKFPLSKNRALEQTVAGIKFNSPIGLAAGFDYEARLPHVLPNLGFGFGTVGTFTNMPYQGNPRPILGRLPKSKSLMVNKGFKNLGAQETIKKLTKQNFRVPIGVSIGRTNTKISMTQKESVNDIINSFKLFENSKVKHSYYELNISCPNLYGDISFYLSKNLNELLSEIDKLKIKRPLFVKMPIEKSNNEILEMLNVISKHSPKGVIFGNLQKDRNNKYLHKAEVAKFPVGNFSGKPTFDQSNELISLTYKNYKNRFVIIGCGGVFSAKDAYEKISRGATLVQLITGMIFEGPQLISQINMGLEDIIKQNGFSNISEAIGSKSKS